MLALGGLVRAAVKPDGGPSASRSIDLSWSDEPLGHVDSVAVEASGWVLAVEGHWPAGSWGDYDLDPHHAPRVLLRIRSPGHERRMGAAVAAARLRTLIATRPLRVSVAGPPMDMSSLDEVDLGGGRRRVRLALSEYVHLGDTIDGVEFAAHWRAGMPHQLLAATNDSMKPVELPTMRWITPPLMRVTADDPTRVELLVASAWAEGLEPATAVCLRATDGQSWTEHWLTAVTTSHGWGDEVRAWGMSAAQLCSGLKPGPVTIHATVYPWIGAARSTGQGHANTPMACFGPRAEVPTVVIWDPAGTHMPEAHVYVDPAAGSAVAAEVTVAPTLAAARAGVSARTPSVAAQAIALAQRTIPAANGWPASARAGDNAVITLAPGEHRFGTQPVSSGATTAQGRMILQGDPEAQNPRTDCVLHLGDRPTWRYSQMLVRSLGLRAGGTSLPFSTAAVHFHDVDIRARPGFESATTPLLSGTAALSRTGFTACHWHKTGATLRAQNHYLIRSCRLGRAAAALVLLNNERVDDGSDGFFLSNVTHSSQPDLGHDQIIWGNRVYAARTSCLLLDGPLIPNSQRHRTLARLRVVNNLFEMCPPRGTRFNGAGRPPTGRNIGSLGEGRCLSAIDCLFENNSFVGQRYSWAYNDPPSADRHDQNRHSGTRLRNCHTDRSATKHDDFRDSKYGFRPGFTDGWSSSFGVGHRSNVLALRWFNADGFKFDFDGLNIVASPTPGFAQGNGWVRFADDRSQFGLAADQSGFGDYAPLPGAPHIGLCFDGNADVDILGRPRLVPFAAGAYEPAG